MPKTECMEVTEYLDGNGEHELLLQYTLSELRGVWADSGRRFNAVHLVQVELVRGTKSLRAHTPFKLWPVGNRNVKVTYWADVPVKDEPCQLCDGEGALECPTCEGEGCGSWGPKYVCCECKGSKVVPCECQAKAKATGKEDWE